MLFNWMVSHICESNIYLVLLGYLAFILPIGAFIVTSIIFIIQYMKHKRKKKALLRLTKKVLITMWVCAILFGIIWKVHDLIHDKVYHDMWPEPEWCGFKFSEE